MEFNQDKYIDLICELSHQPRHVVEDVINSQIGLFCLEIIKMDYSNTYIGSVVYEKEGIRVVRQNENLLRLFRGEVCPDDLVGKVLYR